MPADPLINIITRTSNRPLYFKECRRSIISQTYKNVKHIIGVDDVASESYLTSLPYTRIPSEKILDKDKIPYRKFWYNPPESQGESPAPWNLYMNHLYKEVEDGWVMFLDDDDNFVNEGSLKEICNHLNDENSLIIWKLIIDDAILPTKQCFGNYPIPYEISGIGFMFHSKYLNLAQWDSWGAGDFRVIHNLFNNVKNTVWIDKVLTKTQDGTHLGNGKDKIC
jgi:glycosyltransferase involved in cell wall biosynthesis